MIARNLDENETIESTSQSDLLSSRKPSTGTTLKTWYTVPEPIRRVFDQFPLLTYVPNSLPQRTKAKRDRHTLFVFANNFDSSNSGLSCNPACLKWQAYLKFNDVDFVAAASNNHASPSGSLPFLLPADPALGQHSVPLSTGKIPKWVSQQNLQEEESLNIWHQAYIALVDHNIRNAWLYHLYIIRSNFANVAQSLYVSTASSNSLVRVALAQQLRSAAQAELLKTIHIIDGGEIYTAAAKALAALSTLLGSNNYYSGTRPGLFDASVFAYTQLLLDASLPWEETTLPDMLRTHSTLLEHRQRILSTYMDG